MSRIFTPVDFKKSFDFNLNKIDSSLWTCVIPAAGEGTRLGYELPKILYPILGQPILHHLIKLFQKYCNHFVIIASPDGELKIRAKLEDICQPCNYKIIIQDEPKGMGHAIWQARNVVKSPHTAIVWGDQICLRNNTIFYTIAFHQIDPNNVLTFPSVIKKNPYIHFHRDNSGKILKVLQKRECEIKTLTGENDCGFFCFSTQVLFSVLSKELASPNLLGAQTKEINLLQLFPKFETIGGQVNTLRIAHEEETLGINTVNEAQRVESILRNK